MTYMQVAIGLRQKRVTILLCLPLARSPSMMVRMKLETTG